MTHLEEYNRIIEFRKANPLPKDQYGEKHHIKPKSIYPELVKDKDNIVILSAQEHFLAHYHLWKAYKDELHDKVNTKKMCYAFHRMKKQLFKSDDMESMAKLYEECRKEFSKLRSNMRKGKSLSPETKKKLSQLNKGKNNAMYGHSVTEFMTPERENKWRQSLANRNLSGKNNGMYGRHHTEESRKKMSEKKKGIKHSDEHKKKQSEAIKLWWSKRKVERA